MPNKKFQRKIENFQCENCGFKVQGNGYTNHCPLCLWSKHVDINPGDRLSSCRGLMEPISVYLKSGEYMIKQRCLKCKVINNIKTTKLDNHGKIVKLSITD